METPAFKAKASQAKRSQESPRCSRAMDRQIASATEYPSQRAQRTPASVRREGSRRSWKEAGGYQRGGPNAIGPEDLRRCKKGREARYHTNSGSAIRPKCSDDGPALSPQSSATTRVAADEPRPGRFRDLAAPRRAPQYPVTRSLSQHPGKKMLQCVYIRSDAMRAIQALTELRSASCVSPALTQNAVPRFPRPVAEAVAPLP